MKVVVIGGTGHIGGYLIPLLVKEGYQVTCLSRNEHKKYIEDETWNEVELLQVDRAALEKEGTFGTYVRSLKADVVIDLICFELNSAKQLVEGLQNEVDQLIHCGTVWVYGFNTTIPTVETHPRRPQNEYGQKKAEIEAYHFEQFKENKLPITHIHPGHLVGKGWWALNPQGNFNPTVFKTLAKGEKLTLANFGLETVHHVHAYDVATAFVLAIKNKEKAIGESFIAVSENALTMRSYAHEISNWYGHELDYELMPFEKMKTQLSEEDARESLYHLEYSTVASIEKAKSILNYKPKYTSLEAVKESLTSLM